MALSVDTTPAKHVTVLRNGDGKYEGRKFVVSRRRYRTFDALLSDITHQISAPFGAVRRLYTPKGSRQIRGIDDLEGGATYVAGGSERFKKINYNPQQPGKNWGFTPNVKPGFLADDPPPLILPKKNKKYAQRSAQFHKVRQPVQFTVYRNGLGSDKGTRFLLKAREMKSFETVLSIISFKIRLVEGAVRRLFTLEGGLLHGPEDIVDGGQYVACGHRRFIAAPYGESSQPARTQKLPSIKRRKDPNQASPRTQSNPLPAIQKKTTEKKARSEKDSPAPIEEDKGNDEVMVIVSRGSQADLVEDDPAQIVSENGHSAESDDPDFNANVSDALAIDSLEGMTTPPPNGHVNYDNDLHDTNSDLYETTEGTGENLGELTDGHTPDKERSETEPNPETEEAAPSRLSPDKMIPQGNTVEGSQDTNNPSEVADTTGEAELSVDPGDEVVPKSYSPAMSESSHEAVHEDEVVPDGGDAAEMTPDKEKVTTADSPAADGDNVEEDISRTEVTTVSSKSRSRIPVAKKSNQAGSSDTESVTDSSSEIRNPSSPAPSSPKPAPQEKRTDNDEMTDVKEKPLENRDIKNTTVPNSEENKAVAATPAATNYSDDEFMEEAESDTDLYPESENGDRTFPRLTPFECSSAENAESCNGSPYLDNEEYLESEDGEEHLDEYGSEDGEDNSSEDDYEDLDDRSEDPDNRSEYGNEDKDGRSEHENKDLDDRSEDRDEDLDDRSEDENEDQDDKSEEYHDDKSKVEEDVDVKTDDQDEEEIVSVYTPALSEENDAEDFLEEEIKSLPSKSKLDRNPPKKKSNPELLANGSDDSVFNATAAKQTNQDGQFLMNNVEEGETNGHEDGDEIEEDGELVEDKPIDLQQAEEIPDDDANILKQPNRGSRSQSSNK